MKHNIVTLFRRSFVYILFFFSTIFISTAAYIIFPSEYRKYLLYFPVQHTLRAEIHSIPNALGNREKQVRYFIHELFLGPKDISFHPLFPRGSTTPSVLLRDKTLYVDFDAELFKLHDSLERSLETTFKFFKKNITKNFKFIRKVVIMINGEEV